MPDQSAGATLPWQPQSFVLGNLAIGNVRNNLFASLRTEAGVHAETLLTAAGVLAGFAAQHAALLRGAEATIEAGFVPEKLGVFVVGTKSGQQFVFGDWINQHLLPERGNMFSLYSLVAGATLQAGIDAKDFVDCIEIVGHVAQVAGTPDFGVLRVTQEHQPHLPPVELAKKLWVPVTTLLRSPAPQQMSVSEPPLSELHWPVIFSIVAAQFIGMTKDALNAATGFALVMESAFIGAKIFPETIQPGRWRMTPKDGQLAIMRLGDLSNWM